MKNMSTLDSQKTSETFHEDGIRELLKLLDTYRDFNHDGDYRVNLPADIYDRIHYSHQY